MLLAVRISSYGSTWEVWRALKKLDLLSAIASSNSYASFVLSKLPACIHNSIYARQAWTKLVMILQNVSFLCRRLFSFIAYSKLEFLTR